MVAQFTHLYAKDLDGYITSFGDDHGNMVSIVGSRCMPEGKRLYTPLTVGESAAPKPGTYGSYKAAVAAATGWLEAASH